MTPPKLEQSLTDWLDDFEKRHPEILIAAPWATRSGKWQVIAPGYDKTFENWREMRRVLDERYPKASK